MRIYEKSVMSYWKQGMLCLIMMVLLGHFGYADESAKAGSEPSSSPQQHMSEILNILGLSGKKGAPKPEEKSIPSTIKAADLKSAITILQDTKDREKVIKVLSALLYVQTEAEKKQSTTNNFTDFITSIIDSTSEFLLNSLKFLATIPDAIAKSIHSLADEEHRKDTFNIIVTVLLALTAGIAVEGTVRFAMIKVRFHRPKNYTVFNLPHHIFSNCVPIILFGISAYAIVFYYPAGVGDVLDISFMLVTAIIMIRTSLIILRVLFASRNIRATEKDYQSYISSYQFAIAIIQVLITGTIFAELGMFLGAGEQVHQVWIKILSFGVSSLLVLAVWKIRFWGISKFEFEDEHATSLSLILIRIVQTIGQHWHWVISFTLMLSFFLYFIGMTDHSMFVGSATFLTAILTAIVLWLRNLLQKLFFWLENKASNDDSRFALSLSEQPRITLINFFQILLHSFFIILLFQTWGADPLGLITDKTIHPYLAGTVSIVLIIIIIRLLWIWSNYIATSYVQTKIVNGRKIVPSLFVKTITPILRSVGHWILTITGIVLILEEVGIPIMPIIYGISVIGIAISLGAQSLVKDLINGILTLMEGNIAVGEMVIIGSHTGVVESLSLRGVSLRHSNGALQTIPFSEVSNIINKSRDYTAITLEVPVPYGTDMSKVKEVLQAAYDDMVADHSFHRMVIDPVAISGVDRFTDSGFVVIATIRIKPDPKNHFIRAYNQKLRDYLEKEKITPPANAQTLIITNSDHRPVDVELVPPK